MMVAKLTKEQVEFLKRMSSHVYDGENAWYYMPFWFRSLGEDKFEMLKFEKLPKNVVEIIERMKS